MKIKSNLFVLVGVAAVAFVAGRTDVFSEGGGAWAQEEPQIPPEMQAYIEAGTPGKHHRQLDPMVGQWSGEFKMYMEPGQPPMISRGTVTRDWVLDGRFIREAVEATSDMGTFSGIGYIGYNNVDGQYEVVWLDSMSTGIYTETATLDPDTLVLTSRGSIRDPHSGHVINSRSVLDLSNPNRHVYVGYLTSSDGKEFKHFEGVTQRIN